MIDPAFLHTALALLTAFGLGVLIGLERQYRQRTAGLRTNVLVAVGAAALMGVVLRLHDEPLPGIEAKPVQAVLDREPLVSESLLRLARWVASYYVAPLGEVLREDAAADGGGAAGVDVPDQ